MKKSGWPVDDDEDVDLMMTTIKIELTSSTTS